MTKMMTMGEWKQTFEAMKNCNGDDKALQVLWVQVREKALAAGYGNDIMKYLKACAK